MNAVAPDAVNVADCPIQIVPAEGVSVKEGDAFTFTETVEVEIQPEIFMPVTV